MRSIVWPASDQSFHVIVFCYMSNEFVFSKQKQKHKTKQKQKQQRQDKTRQMGNQVVVGWGCIISFVCQPLLLVLVPLHWDCSSFATFLNILISLNLSIKTFYASYEVSLKTHPSKEYVFFIYMLRTLIYRGI